MFGVANCRPRYLGFQIGLDVSNGEFSDGDPQVMSDRWEVLPGFIDSENASCHESDNFLFRELEPQSSPVTVEHAPNRELDLVRIGQVCEALLFLDDTFVAMLQEQALAVAPRYVEIKHCNL
jgi:hypothetical protein